jgi:uncharacterized integral membrane protein
MRYLRYLFLGTLGVVLITVAVANREAVALNLLPPDVAALTGFSWSVSLPLFVVIFAALVAGIVVGFVWEWLREHKHRVAADTHRRQSARLEREVKSLRQPAPGSQDEVLALLDASGRKA